MWPPRLFSKKQSLLPRTRTSGQSSYGVGLGFGGDIPWLKAVCNAEETYEQSAILLAELGEMNFRARPVRQLGYLRFATAIFRRAYDVHRKPDSQP